MDLMFLHAHNVVLIARIEQKRLLTHLIKRIYVLDHRRRRECTRGWI